MKIPFVIPKYGDQQGMALLLAVSMVAAITVITMTVSLFVIQEIKTARSSTLTEPAIIAAETAGEQGIYSLKRGTFTQPCTGTGSASYTQIDGTSSSSTSTRIKKCLTALPSTFQFSATSPLTFYVYDPTKVNSNFCMEDDAVCPASGGGSGNQIYTSLIFRYLTGGNNINVDIKTMDGLLYNSSILNPGATNTYPISRDIPGADDERLKVVLTPTLGTSTIEVSTTGLYSGLPDYLTIDAIGCRGLNNISSCEGTSEIYKRRINITLPR